MEEKEGEFVVEAPTIPYRREQRRSLSNQGIELLKAGLEAVEATTTIDNNFLETKQEQQQPPTIVYQHTELSSDSDDEEEAIEVHVVGITSNETRLDLVTTERPFKALPVPLHNPVDQSQIIPTSDKTFTKDPWIVTHIWRDDSSAAVALGETSKIQTPPMVQSIRRSIVSSRRSITKSASTALSTFNGDDLLSSSPPTMMEGKKISERKLVVTAQAEKDFEKQVESAKQGLGSDYTLFNRDWSVLLRGKKSSAIWTQFHNRSKHSDIIIYVGPFGDVPIATLKSGARASRLLLLERQSDGGIVYTFAKDKIAGHRVFFICEGRRPNGQVDPKDCRFCLVIRKGRAVLKSRADALLIPHLSTSQDSLRSSSGSSSAFNLCVLDFVDKGEDSVVKIASGMDLVLAFACLTIADRFEKYSCFRPNEKVRTEILNSRFETGIGDKELDVFHRKDKTSAYGTTTGAASLIY